MNLFCNQAPMQTHTHAEGETQWPIAVKYGLGSSEERADQKQGRVNELPKGSSPIPPGLPVTSGSWKRKFGWHPGHWTSEYWLPVWAVSPMREQLGNFRQKPTWPQVEQNVPVLKSSRHQTEFWAGLGELSEVLRLKKLSLELWLRRLVSSSRV